MKDKNGRSALSHTGLGTGYVSVIMIFVMICLVTLAAMSYSAAGSSDPVADKNMTNTNAYYNAECAANRVLMRIDDAAAKAAASGDFSSFETAAKAIEGVIVTASPDGYTAEWKEIVTRRLELICRAAVYADPSAHGGKRYEITEWKTIPGDTTVDAKIKDRDDTH